ncbi:hypothetical protein C8D87_11487 [Lentzea atacamensis]|uniref:Uncharacterized protein n=1 Tax=Lentzea atacamensis TaxID=531938 RepID=A0ABX9DW05_9PSEU|nr:hypothetical protein [Lentzea atacamensis]RAS59475.1 hypothetical protein C8D87_11487 [Lentzea atacamensis]
MPNPFPQPGTVIEIKHPEPHSEQSTVEPGVILEAAMDGFFTYFPGTLDQPADPMNSSSFRVVAAAEVTTCRALAECDPAWVAGTWTSLKQAGLGLLRPPPGQPMLLILRFWELAATLAQHRLDQPLTQLITREQLEEWVGRSVSDDDLAQLDVAIPNSSIPQSLADIIASLDAEDAG